MDAWFWWEHLQQTNLLYFLQGRFLEFLFKRDRVIGSTQNGREYLYEALDYVAKGKVKVMTEIFPLEEISHAYDKVSNGNVRFKAVIEPIK